MQINTSKPCTGILFCNPRITPYLWSMLFSWSFVKVLFAWKTIHKNCFKSSTSFLSSDSTFFRRGRNISMHIRVSKTKNEKYFLIHFREEDYWWMKMYEWYTDKKNSQTFRFGKATSCLFWNGTIRFGNEKFSYAIWFFSDRQWNQY